MRSQERLKAVRGGEAVGAGGGSGGKVAKASEEELEVGVGKGVRVTAVRSTIAEGRVKGEPIANQNAKK